MHEGIKVFVDHDNDWLVEFKTACTELRSDFRCGSYETRPRVCRDYPGPTQECEFESADSPYKLLFTNVSEFEQYLESRGIDWKYRT
jgi:Fe-S-cluster containining protein